MRGNAEQLFAARLSEAIRCCLQLRRNTVGPAREPSVDILVCELSERLLHPMRVLPQKRELRWFDGRRDANAARPV